MDIEIIDKPFTVELYGFSGVAVNRNFGETGMRLMNKMWGLVKSNQLKNKGVNVWVYENQNLFTGVELEETPGNNIGLEFKKVTLVKYVRYKHIGPYHKLYEANAHLREAVTAKGYKTAYPCLEIYGHATPNENESETDILVSLL
jgi:effector-binding domain-containing protein